MQYLSQTHGSPSSDCHCGGHIKSMYWGGPYRHVCEVCGCSVRTDTEELTGEIPITSVTCSMKYVILKSSDGKTEKVMHVNDVEKLIAKGKAIWVVSPNGVRFAKLVETEE